MTTEDPLLQGNLTLGCIADDFTGATDLANNLALAGMRTVVTTGLPAQGIIPADAIVIALKSRTISVVDAVAQSVAACRWLREHGAEHIYFKICSTFDSTSRGNIGPVIDALMDELGCDFTVVAPAFPDNQRTVFRGHLFVEDSLLSESGMRNHPLTPMRDANLGRVLQAQMDAMSERRVGLIDYRSTGRSADAIRLRMDELRTQGISVAIADAISNDDLIRLADAASDAPLITASSGLGIALPGSWGFQPSSGSNRLPGAEGRLAIVSGSCSTATNAQVRRYIDKGGASYAIAPEKLAADAEEEVANALAWAETQWRQNPCQPLLFYSTAEADAVRSTHVRLGVERAGTLVEEALGAITQGLVERGAGKLVVVGGETSGVCVKALGIEQLQIGPQIDPGVPWCYAKSPRSSTGGLHIALKSGNFGAEDFFGYAFACLTERSDD